MARALKIQKYGTAQGITINSNGTVNQPAAAVPVDQGYPNFGSLTNPVYNSADTLSADDFIGVVGGNSSTATTTSYPIILPQVNISLADGTDTTAGNGRIIRQKGSHKFLVAYVASTTADGSFIVGQAYQIVSTGTTVWANVGAGRDTVAAGDIFTATAANGGGDGTAYPVGVCVLSNTGTPAAGFMSIEYSVGDSSAVYASYITNKWIRDWNGMTYGNYSNSNFGTNIQSGENFYPVNFFTDEGTVTWSGAEIINGAEAQNGSLQLAQVVKATS
jgi:hypothetical protein